MLKKNKLLLFLLWIFSSALSAQENSMEIMTLFTTQQERQLIDNNRYRVKTEKSSKPAVVKQEPEPDRKVVYKQEVLTVKVSGITLTQDGKNIAWINGQAIENGGRLDDGSMVYISPKIKKFAQIKTPDGKYHSVSTGDTEELTYLKPILGK